MTGEVGFAVKGCDMLPESLAYMRCGGSYVNRFTVFACRKITFSPVMWSLYPVTNNLARYTESDGFVVLPLFVGVKLVTRTAAFDPKRSLAI